MAPAAPRPIVYFTVSGLCIYFEGSAKTIDGPGFSELKAPIESVLILAGSGKIGFYSNHPVDPYTMASD